MKNYIILIALFISIQTKAQKIDNVLLKVGNSDVTVGEFKYIYEKNNGSNADYSEKSINEYLDLYIKFKLKVEKAKAIQLDTISELKSELEGYRKQLASSYLIDKEVSNFLLKELYERMKYDVEFSHIFIPVPENSSKAVKAAAKNEIRDIKSKIVAGMTFEEAAAKFSQDKISSVKGGKMGYFTAKLPIGFYELESAIYNTKPGSVSEIVESKIGFHLVKVTNKRPARGLIEVAHILFKDDQKDHADTIYKQLLEGQDFGVTVFNFSSDQATNQNGGKLPIFGINTYDGAFEDAAFSLQNDGEISTPIKTSSGWHLIKRISRPTVESFGLFIRRMKTQINNDPRFDAAKNKLITDIQRASGFKENKVELDKFVVSLNDEFYSYRWLPDTNLSTKPFMVIGESENFSISDFAEFCKKNTRTRLKYDSSKPIAETIEELYLEFVNEATLDYEEKMLESKYADFKSLMREYEEGILLFEATKINVWDKANQDTTGLKAFYEDNSADYFWEEKAKIVDVRFTGLSDKEAKKVYKYAIKNSLSGIESKFKKNNVVFNMTDSEYEKASKELTGLQWKLNATTSLEMNPQTKSYFFKKIVEIKPSKIKTLSEARGYVVADYQDYLEKEWMKQLTSEFDVMIFKVVLNQLIK